MENFKWENYRDTKEGTTEVKKSRDGRTGGREAKG